MKKRYSFHHYLAMLVLATSFWGCKTAYVQLNVLQPADITVSGDIKQLALLNRFYPEKKDKALGVVEGILTGEGFGQDRRAADAALSGLTNALAGSPRFTIVRPNKEVLGKGQGVFPPMIDPALVKEICTSSHSQALVTIEALDSDSRLACVPEVRTRKNKENVEEKYTVFKATKSIDMTVGWRMYDGANGGLIDEFRMFETVNFNAEGNTEPLAIANLPGKEQVLQEVGRVTGQRYSMRISPSWVWVGRSYYKKGSGALKTAKKYVKTNQWDRAEAIWDKGLENPDPKVKARVLHNLALAAELNGNLESALELARESISKQSKYLTSDYIRILEQRLADQRKLDAQMEGAPK